jgi:hypothetical protein
VPLLNLSLPKLESKDDREEDNCTRAGEYGKVLFFPGEMLLTSKSSDLVL